MKNGIKLRSVAQLKNLFLKNKIKYFIIGLSICLILFFLIPFIKVQLDIASLRIKDVEQLVYVEYEGEPFQSPVIYKKVMNINEDKDTIDQFLYRLKNATIQIHIPEKKSSKMVFIYLKSGKVINGYTVDDKLGLMYGRSWIYVKELQQFLENMKIEDIVTINTITENN